jgi:predicted CoA-binding protein
MTTPLADPTLHDLATQPGVIAVVGFSPRPDRPSHGVAAYLIQQGLTVHLVNPTAAGQTALGRIILASLLDVPEHVHIVDVFRRPEEVLQIVADAIQIGADALWFQLDIINPAAIERARAAGMQVVVDRCLKVEHARLAHGG